MLPYLTEMAVDALKDFEHLVVVGTRPPVGFFAYPGKPSLLWNPETTVTVLATPDEDALGALEALADLVGRRCRRPVEPLRAPELPSGEARLRHADPRDRRRADPEGAVVVDESVTASAFIQPHLAARPSTTTCT